MGIFFKKWVVLLQAIHLVIALPMVANAKLVHSLKDMYSEQSLRSFVFKTNQQKFSYKDSLVWLKTTFPTAKDHQYIDAHFKKVTFRIKPVLFYYSGYIEVRVHGKSYGKISDIDFMNNTVKLNQQDIQFKEGQSITDLHKQILSAMEGHVAWNPMELFISKAHAYGSIVSVLGLFFMAKTLKGAQKSTFEGQSTQRIEELCKNPGRASKSRGLSLADRNMMDYAFHTTKDCRGSAYVFLESNPPASAERINRATSLCNNAKKIKRECINRDKSNGTTQPTTSPRTSF